MKTLRDFVVEPSWDVGGSDFYFCGTKILFGAMANGIFFLDNRHPRISGLKHKKKLKRIIAWKF